MKFFSSSIFLIMKNDELLTLSFMSPAKKKGFLASSLSPIYLLRNMNFYFIFCRNFHPLSCCLNLINSEKKNPAVSISYVFCNQL